ncbi:MAG: glycine cleavage system protein GcvH [Rhodocyclaceae bacterium]|nr:glycine cleavage system protein GcvH [Rhodocyclaceae bacterium]
MYPGEYLYTREHEWVHVNGDIATMGVTEFAQQELGEVVFIELPGPDQHCAAGDEIGTIESVKAVAEIYAPATGTVVECNAAVVDSPELLNDDPHGEGWLLKIRLGSPHELAALMNAAAYAEYVRSGAE